MCKIMLKIDGTITAIEVYPEIYEFDKTNFWQENWRDRKRKQENSLEEMHEDFNLSNKSAEEKYFEEFNKQKLYEAINMLPKV